LAYLEFSFADLNSLANAIFCNSLTGGMLNGSTCFSVPWHLEPFHPSTFIQVHKCGLKAGIHLKTL